LPGLEGLETVGESLLSSGVGPRFRGVLAGLEAVGKILPFFRSSGTSKILAGF
jgi:hypothetical protein